VARRREPLGSEIQQRQRFALGTRTGLFEPDYQLAKWNRRQNVVEIERVARKRAGAYAYGYQIPPRVTRAAERRRR